MLYSVEEKNKVKKMCDTLVKLYETKSLHNKIFFGEKTVCGSGYFGAFKVSNSQTNGHIRSRGICQYIHGFAPSVAGLKLREVIQKLRVLNIY